MPIASHRASKALACGRQFGGPPSAGQTTAGGTCKSSNRFLAYFRAGAVLVEELAVTRRGHDKQLAASALATKNPGPLGRTAEIDDTRMT